MTYSRRSSNKKGSVSRWLKLTIGLCCCCSTLAFSPSWARQPAFTLTRRLAKEGEAFLLASADGKNSTILYSFNQTAGDSASAVVGTARFGDVVSVRRPGSASSSSRSSGSIAIADNLIATESPPTASTSYRETQKRRQLGVAFASVSLAVLNFVWQLSHPITAISILADMERQSAPVSVIGHNDKPTLVDFWAPWCENCKLMAPTLQAVEQEYKNKVNFVMINGDRAEAWPLIEAFRVDAIPHMALVSADGKVETALIGPVPKKVLEADLDTLLENAQASKSKKELPFQMLDVFTYEPELRKVDFSSE